MEIRFYCNIGDPAIQKISEVVDLAKYWGMSADDARECWEEMDETERIDEVRGWVWNKDLKIEIGYGNEGEG